MNYRKALVESDFNLSFDLAKKAFFSTPDSNLDDWFSFEEMVNNIKNKRGICLISSDGESNGMIYAQQESPINGREGLEKWVIIITGIDPNHTGKGIGSFLLESLEKETKLLGCKKLFIFTNKGDDKVINFYKKNGFVDAGWIKDYQYGEDNSAVFLLKHL